jgi:hypothetical protein
MNPIRVDLLLRHVDTMKEIDSLNCRVVVALIAVNRLGRRRQSRRVTRAR